MTKSQFRSCSFATSAYEMLDADGGVVIAARSCQLLVIAEILIFTLYVRQSPT